MDPNVHTQPIVYPVRDGKPMGETDEHRDEMMYYAIDVLRAFFAADPMVYVSGNNFIYYTEGVPGDCVSPDAYVVRGVPNRLREIYKVWEEGSKVPVFALEVTSKSTRSEDLGVKKSKYQDDLKVREYFLFDLRGDWLPERLRGYRLAGDLYLPIPANAAGRLPSEELALELGVQGRHLRFFRPGMAEPLPTNAERAAQEHARAESERERAESERKRAERERARAATAEAEVARLRAEIERLRGG